MNVNFEAIEKAWFKPKKTVLDELEEWIVKLRKQVSEKNKEIERLNNIINELEKYLEEQSTNLNRLSCSGHVYFMYQEDLNILNKLKELKESGNNE